MHGGVSFESLWECSDLGLGGLLGISSVIYMRRDLCIKISLKKNGKKRLRLKIGFTKTVMMRWAQEIKRENLDLLLNKWSDKISAGNDAEGTIVKNSEDEMLNQILILVASGWWLAAVAECGHLLFSSSACTCWSMQPSWPWPSSWWAVQRRVLRMLFI